MKIDLKKYLNERDQLMDESKQPGPVLTLSREYGCDANRIAIKLITKISEKFKAMSNPPVWKYINKEILDHSSKELKLSPERLEQRVITHGSNPVDEIFSSLSHQYGLTDKKIIKTVKEVVEAYAVRGNVVIIGRGGAQIAHNIKKSVHVRLMAPMDWRAHVMAKKKSIKASEAVKLIEMVDKERRDWSEKLNKKPFDLSYFDVVLNRKKLNDDEIVDIIFRLMEDRELI